MLRNAGFAVLEAADGTAAVDLLRGNGRGIDVILLDVTIPGLSSGEVVEAAADIPNIGIILTSAYSQEMSTSPVRAAQIRGFIRKPYRLRDLTQVLRRVATSQTECAYIAGDS
jgi:CheY-like chemotaxis protein